MKRKKIQIIAIVNALWLIATLILGFLILLNQAQKAESKLNLKSTIQNQDSYLSYKTGSSEDFITPWHIENPQKFCNVK
ncbi:hypothetical protein J4411_01520 [Candidatus Pacearchaeota archaeon]|nr:hypothetical protein [Candidatus Pacearchaeota archaeon]